MVLRISKKKIYFNTKDFILLENSNFPVETLMFNQREEALWKVNIVETDESIKALTIEVTDYYSKETELFNNQERGSFLHLNFVNLEFDKLTVFLSYYSKVDLIPLLNKSEQEEFAKLEASNINLPVATQPISSPTLHNEEFTIPFKDVKLEDGFAIITKTFSFHYEPIDVRIRNNTIIKQYDHIKQYLIKLLKLKNINVKATITIHNYNVNKIEAISNEINLITPELIDLVKRKKTLEILKVEQKSNKTKSIFDLAEILEGIHGLNKDHEIIEKNPESVLNLLLEDRTIRSEKEIRFLSKRQSLKKKMMFTLKPLFGFVFLIEGVKQNFYCWELLNSHATYIWGMDKNNPLEELLNEVENAIGLIRNINRIKYRAYYTSKSKELKYSFNFLTHQSDKTISNESFEQWRNKLNKILKE